MRCGTLLVLSLAVACIGCSGKQDDAARRLDALEQQSLAMRQEGALRDERVLSLEQQVTQLGAEVNAVGARVDRMASVPASGGRKVEPAPAKGGRAVGAAPVASRAEAPAKAAGGDKGAYQNALRLLESGKAAAAYDKFDSFAGEYPASSLVPNSLYWKGEALYAQRRYADAILAFKDVLARFPKHHKSADALLKSGLAYQKLGDKDNASFHFKALQDDFPASEAARMARSRGLMP